MEQQNYFDSFGDWSDVLRDFELDRAMQEPDFIWASYSHGGYDGNATVIFYDSATSQWKLSQGSHCSCYGLEGQWSDEPFDPLVHLEAVGEGKRYISDYSWSKGFSEEFDAWLEWAMTHTRGV